jgi:hypothetical protein
MLRPTAFMDVISLDAIVGCSDAGRLSFFDRDHHRGDNRDTGEQVGPEIGLEVARLSFPAHLKLEAPPTEGVGT